jgi:hypothetical protein
MWEGTHMWTEANGRTAKGGEGGRWLWVGIEAPLFGLQVYVSTMESRNHPITATQRRTHLSGERSCASQTAAEPWKSHMQVGDSAFYNMTSPGGVCAGCNPEMTLLVGCVWHVVQKSFHVSRMDVRALVPVDVYISCEVNAARGPGAIAGAIGQHAGMWSFVELDMIHCSTLF